MVILRVQRGTSVKYTPERGQGRQAVSLGLLLEFWVTVDGRSDAHIAQGGQEVFPQGVLGSRALLCEDGLELPRHRPPSALLSHSCCKLSFVLLSGSSPSWTVFPQSLALHTPLCRLSSVQMLPS